MGEDRGKEAGLSGADSKVNVDGWDPDVDGDSTLTPRETEDRAALLVDREAIHQETRRQFELVPEIGTRWRWYDIPYRFLTWLLLGWRRRFIPWRLRSQINNARSFFVAFNHFERLKIEQRTDPRTNLIVPDDEEVTQGAIWVVEFFPPSYYEGLLRSLGRNGWGDNDLVGSFNGSNAQRVARARRGSGFLWSRLGTVANSNSPYIVPNAKREVLPPEFEIVELTGVQLGTSLTAVVAFIQFSETGRTALNEVWKSKHEPTFEWRGLRRPLLDSRYFSGIVATQRERQRIHDVARTWLAERCGGFFAQTEAGQPVIDFNMFAQFDPTTTMVDRAMRGPIQALAFDGNFIYNYVSPQIPGAVLVPGEAPRPPREALQNCWGVVGAHQVFADANEGGGYGDKPYSVGTLAAMVNDAVRTFLLHDAVLRYAQQLKEQAATQRDTARSKHRQFSTRQIDALKHDLLANSLDLPAVARDTEELWGPMWQCWEGLDVKGVPVPGTLDPVDEFDMIKEFGETRTQLFESLIADDAAYRAVLATTSSLGASAASARLGKRALLVSCVSLIVSATTLVVVNGSIVWSRIVD